MLYAITDRRQYGADDANARARLLEQTAAWVAHGVAFIQLREKDLSARDQVELARTMMQVVRLARQDGESGLRTPRLLVNGRADVALAAEADGVHLPAGPEALTPDEVRRLFRGAGRTQTPAISVSCHTLAEIEAVRAQSPDCILFAPVFEKVIVERESTAESNVLSIAKHVIPGTGLALLEHACRAAAPVPVFALGGVTAVNVEECLRAGAAGVAAIRLLQEPASVWQHLA